jgi:MFS family permease
MIYPLLPRYLSSLGAGAATLGGIEGAAESVAALLKLASGWWSDKVRRRKPIVVAGYALAALARPLVAVSRTAGHVLAIRLTDRIGKGLRTAPRDALIADSVDASRRGRAFGFHRAADHAGAVVGPLLAFALLSFLGASPTTVFWLAAVPGMLSVVTLLALVREVPRPAESRPRATLRAPLPSGFRRFLMVIFVFTLGNSSDAFLVLRATELGVPLEALPLMWALLHVVKAASSTPSGALSDRVGRKPLLLGGWLWYAAIYVGLAAATQTWHAWALIGAYGLFFGMTEGVEKALVADLVPADRRGTAFGWFNLAIGIGALPASLLFGLVWERWDSSVAYAAGATLAVLAAAGLLLVPSPAPSGRGAV